MEVTAFSETSGLSIKLQGVASFLLVSQNSHPSSAKDRNEWLYTFTPPYTPSRREQGQIYLCILVAIAFQNVTHTVRPTHLSYRDEQSQHNSSAQLNLVDNSGKHSSLR
jgi:hypothetical protein